MEREYGVGRGGERDRESHNTVNFRYNIVAYRFLYCCSSRGGSTKKLGNKKKIIHCIEFFIVEAHCVSTPSQY